MTARPVDGGVIALDPGDFVEREEYTRTNSTDLVYTDDGALLSTALEPDSALLAWKVLVIRSSLDEMICGEPDGPNLPPGAGGGPPGG